MSSHLRHTRVAVPFVAAVAALLGFVALTRAAEITPSRDNDKYEVLVSYPERDILQSGWLIGEEHLSGHAAMISAAYGQGRVVLIGFRPQHRAQTYGTFQLVFNALIQ